MRFFFCLLPPLDLDVAMVNKLWMMPWSSSAVAVAVGSKIEGQGVSTKPQLPFEDEAMLESQTSSDEVRILL